MCCQRFRPVIGRSYGPSHVEVSLRRSKPVNIGRRGTDPEPVLFSVKRRVGRGER